MNGRTPGPLRTPHGGGKKVGKRLGLILGAALAVLPAGCSKSEPPRDTAGQTIFQGQIRALDKAKGVQQTLDAADRRERKAITQDSR